MRRRDMAAIHIEIFVYRLQCARSEMWLNVALEFYGAIKVWIKAADVFVEMLDSAEEHTPPKTKLTFQKVIFYMWRQGHTNLTNDSLYPGKPLFLTQLYLVLSNFNIESLTKFFPVEYRVRSIRYTTKQRYQDERWFYRIAHSVASEGDDLKKHKYEEYKFIAQKYNWPFIVNGNDAEY